MQAVAAEMNVAETAFVVCGPRERPITAPMGLRWFSPVTEVDLCGHATLAAAHALWESGRLPGDLPARFQTRKSGQLTCVRQDDGWIEMDFPATPATPVTSPPPDLIESLGAATAAAPVRRSAFDYLVQLESEADVRRLRPDFARLARIEMRGVIVTSRSADPVFDFVCRFFCPAVGINEDPVTGSAYCALAGYWAPILGRERFVARQISSRGGIVRATLRGDRVVLGGQAVTVFHGELRS
jgi:PhzF family phenazine biosynthesis protein